LGGGLRDGSAAAMSVPLKTESRASKFAPEQQHRGDGNYQQRDQLLPIHAGKITPKSPGATRDFQNKVIFYCLEQNKTLLQVAFNSAF
jgi:hypothetical protein